MKRYLWPFAIFLVVAGFLAFGLKLDPREVPSPLIGKPAPEFRLGVLANPQQTIAKRDLAGKVWMLNVWASWCVACREEHPLLVDYARRKRLPIYGLNYKDDGAAATAWLQQRGNPYDDSLVDANGRVGIDFGVYGVPETFVIDRAGIIRYKHIGPLTPQVLSDEIEPLLRRLDA